MHKKGLTQPENRSNSNFRTSTCLALPKKCRKNPGHKSILKVYSGYVLICKCFCLIFMFLYRLELLFYRWKFRLPSREGSFENAETDVQDSEGVYDTVHHPWLHHTRRPAYRLWTKTIQLDQLWKLLCVWLHSATGKTLGQVSVKGKVAKSTWWT